LRLPMRSGIAEYRCGETTGELLERAEHSLSDCRLVVDQSLPSDS
jgi:hypothetical protein